MRTLGAELRLLAVRGAGLPADGFFGTGFSLEASGRNSEGELALSAILLVEDEPLVAEVLRAFLEDAGFAIEWAPSGEAAVELIKIRGSAVQAIITDIRLSGRVSGWDVARVARSVHEEIAVVYTSGDSEVDFKRFAVPRSRMLVKPLDGKDLVSGLAAAVATASERG